MYVGMGWQPNKLNGKQVLLLSTQGGMKDSNGDPITLGYHTGHWEVDMLMKEAAMEVSKSQGVPFATYVSDPCDGRSQGTTGMFDSFPYRNEASPFHLLLEKMQVKFKPLVHVTLMTSFPLRKQLN